MIGDLVLDAEATEPAIGEIEPDLAAQRAFRANGEHVADDEHPNHQQRIDRGAADQRIMRRQRGAHPGQVQNHCNLADKMIVRHDLLKIE